MKPIIGIAGNQLLQSVPTFQGNQVTYTPQGFVTAIQEAGGLPLVLPVGAPESAETYIAQIDKLLLAGGQDVAPYLYNEEPHPKLGETNPDRDQFERTLILEAIKQGKPIFAVCRGMQLLNVVLGGSLYQDLSLYPDCQVKHEQQPTQPQFATHSITVKPDSLLVPILGTENRVNSYHHQAIKQLADSLKAIAWSSDGVIEAVTSIDSQRRILGVQWHPELTFDVIKAEADLFDFAVNKL